MALRVTLTCLAALFLLSGCGGDAAESGAARGEIVSAAERTGAAESYRSAFELSFEGLTDETLHIRGSGAAQGEPARTAMTMDLREFGRAAGQELGEADVVFDGPTLYLRFPALASALTDVEPWLRFRTEEFAADPELGLGQLAQLAQADPGHALVQLRGAGESVEEVGGEDLRGEPTTHYRLTVDLDRVAREAPERRRAVERLVAMSGVKEVPTDVWLDGEGRVRRLRLVYEDVRFAERQEADMTVTMELYDFGADVEVAPPARDEVTDIRDVVGRGAEETKHSEE